MERCCDLMHISLENDWYKFSRLYRPDCLFLEHNLDRSTSRYYALHSSTCFQAQILRWAEVYHLLHCNAPLERFREELYSSWFFLLLSISANVASLCCVSAKLKFVSNELQIFPFLFMKWIPWLDWTIPKKKHAVVKCLFTNFSHFV